MPGHGPSGVVTDLGYGTTGLTVGQRAFGLADWTRDGSIAVQLARELDARVISTRAADREAALGLGADAFVDLQADRLEEVGQVDVVFDVIGGEILERSVPLVRADGTLVTIVGQPKARPADGPAIFFVVEPDRSRLADLAQRVRSGRLKPIIGAYGRSPRHRPRSRRPPGARQDDHPQPPRVSGAMSLS